MRTVYIKKHTSKQEPETNPERIKVLEKLITSDDKDRRVDIYRNAVRAANELMAYKDNEIRELKDRIEELSSKESSQRTAIINIINEEREWLRTYSSTAPHIAKDDCDHLSITVYHRILEILEGQEGTKKEDK